MDFSVLFKLSIVNSRNRLKLICAFEVSLSFPQYLRKVIGEKKDAENKIKIDGVEIDLAEGTDEVRSQGS